MSRISPKQKSEPLRLSALPMYDLPQLEPATDALWSAIAERLISAGANAPSSLARGDDYAAVWRDPNLLLSQTCGYPLLKKLRQNVQLVATPAYAVPGCIGTKHSSFFIVNAASGNEELSDLRGRVCVVNEFDSNTGMNLLRYAVAPLAKEAIFFHSVIITGSHHNSLKAVAGGRADLAAIDCVSFYHFARFEPELTSQVRIIGQSQPIEAPPFITSHNTEPATLRILQDALMDAARSPSLQWAFAALAIEGFETRTFADYEDILRLEKEALSFGYHTLS